MALVGRPELVFVDEPTAGLDPHIRRDVWDLLTELRGDGVTVVLTTHLIDEAERLADTVHVIDHGRLIATGSPADLVSRPSQLSGPAAPAVRMTAAFSGLMDLDRLRVALPGLHVRVPAETPADPDGGDRVRAIELVGPITPDAVVALATCAAQSDLLVVDLRVDDGRRTLEDVFLDLTRAEATT